MLRIFLNTSINIEEIEITFLIVGHTYMPVDSMHGVIEKSVKNKIIQAPSEWATILRNARTNPEPYIVKQITYSAFLDWKSVKVEKGSQIKSVANIKRALFLKNSLDVKYNYSFVNNKDDETLRLEIKTDQPKRLYNAELPINKAKFANLQSLCQKMIIKPQYHIEYLTLKTSNAVPDVLDDSDKEDE